ncbi:OTU-domain-containing protein [Mollisia scopiformis]|uniref:OTU-domain-containing protein n=1 Tax=Mollisia scopiformis TaxID=149040 RepID=A0A194X9S2_MOLSC|nr:OTU-domain-containing protein [Mollisia scopiformis]KUJ16522.1 OTU-domain-containing protein [Mollisia scopiformis]
MGRNTRQPKSDFPFLAGLGLKTTSIRGDGNCLFRALSEQIYGDQTRNSEIRAKVVQYMKANPGDFKPFISVETGGGFRRNPKRKNAAAGDLTGPSESERDQAWEDYLVRMARNGEYGDNLEIRAFTEAYTVDVRVYCMPASSYIIRCGQELATGEYRQIAHIALYSEHYSSIRNINGPDTGLPNAKPSDLEALVANQATTTKASKTMAIEQWMVNSVSSSLPNFVDEDTITKILQANKGDVDITVSQLLGDTDSPSSTIPSTPNSSISSNSGNYSIVRDEDSEDEEPRGPNKRQARKEKERLERERISNLEAEIEAKLAAMPHLHVSTVYT